MIPFYMYAMISVYVFISAGYRFDVFNFVSVTVLTVGLITAATFFSFRSKILHLLALLILLALGGIGIYIGLILDPINWIELIASAFIIAFALAFYEMVEHRREAYNERD